MNSKVKVSTERLLDAVRKRRDDMVRDHAKAVAKYATDIEHTRPRVSKALRDAADRVDAGSNLPDIGSRYGGRRGREYQICVPCGFDLPIEPSSDPGTHQIDRLIRTLEMASDTSIGISAEDAYRYLG